MSGGADLRPAVAAVIMLAVLAGTYQLALQLPAALPAGTLASADLPMMTDSAAAVAAGLVVQPALSPAPTSVAAAEPPPCPAEPIRFVPLDRDERRPLSLHRYVGTVGGQPATVLLEWRTPAKVRGSFYWHRGGPMYELYLREWRKGQAVLLVNNFDNLDLGEPSEWRLLGLPGAVLRGTWHDTTGNHPVYLRESYAGAVRADVHKLRLEGGQAHHGSYSSQCVAGFYYYDYLQFPAPWAVAPALRLAIGQPSAVVRRRLRASYDEVLDQQRELTDFLLNDFNLLSYRIARSSALSIQSKGDSWTEFHLFDLTTGRELSLASQLRPGYERPLRRLLQHHLLHERQFDFINREHRVVWNWQDSASKTPRLVTLPKAENPDDNNDHASNLFLTGSGLDATYLSYALYYDKEPGSRTHTIHIPYRELRPLVRPGTPLARMLRARGMW